MSDPRPSVEDEVERALRLGLATASQIADRYARARQDSARQAQHRDQLEARQLENRYRAEAASATARLAQVDRTEWWDRATPADITSMWQLAAQWQDEQLHAAIAAETIARQVQDRYGVDVRAPGVDSEVLRAGAIRLDTEQRDRAGQPRDREDTATAVAAVVRAKQRDASLVPAAVEHQQMGEVQQEHDAARAAPLYNRQAAAGGRASLTMTKPQAPTADGQNQASQHLSAVLTTATRGEPDSALSYDSVGRREQTAARLHESGLPAEAVAVAMRADVAHAYPATQSGTARITPSQGAGPRVMRGARSRDREH